MPNPATSILVPVSLEALAVGNGDTQRICFTDPEADFTRYPYVNNAGETKNPGAPISENVLNPPFESNSSMPPGVHLHWALPDALTHGYHSPDDNQAVFPDVPNRWLVTRLWQTAAGMQARSWVVESNCLSSTSQGRNVTVPNLYTDSSQTGPTFLYLGRYYPLADWQERELGTPGSYLPHLTAIGYGTPSFASIYQNCRSVFGFFDDVSDLTGPAALTYVVTGWYGGAALDPVQPEWVNELLALTHNTPANNPAVNQATALGIYKWIVAGAPDLSGLAHTLCSGVLLSVQWDPGSGKSYFDNDPANDITIAVGNTHTEALSAFLANRMASAQYGNVEQFLNAFQLGILPQLAKPDGLEQLEELLHQGSFEKHDGGSVWVLQRQESQPVSMNAPGTPPPPAPDETTIPASYAGDLDKLNQLQFKFDTGTDALQAAQQGVFWDWYKYMIIEHGQVSIFNPPAGYPDVNAIYNYLVQWVGNPDDPTRSYQIQTLREALAALEGQIQSASAAIQKNLQTAGLPFDLVNTSAPRYWRPNDPAFLFSGPAIQLSQRYGQNGRFNSDGTLTCRTELQVISSVAAGGSTVTSNCYSLTPQPPGNCPYAILNSLAQEASIYRALYLSQPDLQALLKTLASGVTAPAQAPSPLEITAWATPWIPLVIQWELQYVPASGQSSKQGVVIPYSPDYARNNYSFDPDDNKFSYTGPAPNPLNLTVYRGSVVITPATVNLQGQIRNYLLVNPDPELQAVLDQITALPLLAQSLSGVNDALLMRKLTLQMAVNDPIASTISLLNFTNINCANAIGPTNNTGPLPANIFCGLRGGFAQLSKLRVIDAFGRFKTINPNALVPSESMCGPASLPANYFSLLPRLSQPARLQFRYLAANDQISEMNSVVASTPVCGWIVPTYLNNTLLVCGAAGEAIGFLTRTPNGQAITCFPAPGNPVQDPSIDALFQGKNPHLKAVVQGICGNSTAFFDTLVDTTDLALGRIDPEDFQSRQSLSVLMGRPLAVVRSMLKLEIQGKPATDQSWDAFKQTVRPTTPDWDPTRGFTKVEFAAQVGQFGKVNDGLVGYFLEAAAQPYQTFYTPVPNVNQNGVVPTGNEIQLNSDPGNPGVILIMLVDPRARVHAKIGILPVKAIEIPNYIFAQALRFLNIAFTARPMLLREDQIQIPLPKEAGGQWSWLERNGNTWATNPSLTDSTDRATLFPSGQVIRDGWLQLSPASQNP